MRSESPASGDPAWCGGLALPACADDADARVCTVTSGGDIDAALRVCVCVCVVVISLGGSSGVR